MFEKIFPKLKEGKWAEINLNEESKKVDRDLSKIEECKKWIKLISKEKGIDYIFGGFKENRSNLWKNHYNAQSEKFIHLGMDFTVPNGTIVSIPEKGRLIYIRDDEDSFGGWGREIIWELESGNYLLIGHLSKEEEKEIVGKIQESGTIIGKVGDSNENGGWWPHLHVQLMEKEFIENHKKMEDIDGYLKEGDELIKLVINPLEIIK